MIGLPIFHREPPVLTGSEVVLRFPRRSNYAEWSALRRESRWFLEPWEPLWSPDELQRPAWNARMRRYRQEMTAGSAVGYFIFHKKNSNLLGGITIGNIRYGVSQSAQIGYWMGARHAGNGFMQDAIGALLEHAFNGMRLHRIEAACIPTNTRSMHVLEKAGFTREGLLRSYLRINGVWQDHCIYSLIADEHRQKQESMQDRKIPVSRDENREAKL